MTPRATMRLQFRKAFTFADAERLVPYFADLGVSHLYASPITTARAGSAHGYDVVDPTRVNPELGGEEALRRLAEALRGAGMGIIADIVPNHMAIGADNPWWTDVLRHGPASRHARWFDIDWAPEDRSLQGKVLLPVLGRPYGDALAAGEIMLAQETDGTVAVRYFQQMFPISDRDAVAITEEPLAAFDPSHRDGRLRLHGLLERQHYRLAWWRAAADAINWRRFFDVNELAALRVEDDDVFESVHAMIFRLYAEGLIDGLRIDHIDGLSDPAGYCARLRSRLAELAMRRPAPLQQRAYVIVEKIFGRGETLPSGWGCDGTTGYDFMDEVSALLHDARGEKRLTETWMSVSGRPGDFAVEEEAARREIVARSFAAQHDSVAAAFHAVAQGNLSTRDIGRPALRRALTELLAHFPVYRTYPPSHVAHDDRRFLAQAASQAKATCLPADREVVDRVQEWLGADKPDAALATAMARFQQLSAPVAAKAVEDTAFYRYGRLLSRNDVGFDVSRFSDTPAAFHERAQARHAHEPHTMLATATHDHKRGEDVRARLAVLSEVADEWSTVLERWLDQCEPLRRHVDGKALPSGGDLAILFQTIVGAWPLTLQPRDQVGCAAFAERLALWQRKALREAKLATDWIVPNEAYEQAAQDVLMQIVTGPSGLREEIAAFVDRIATAGVVNGLAQMVLKLTSPGVPDIYQGTEYWDFSLVDPDNRNAVDFAARRASLSAGPIRGLVQKWRDGRIKQAVLSGILALRCEKPQLFGEGEYVPLPAQGEYADHVVAFARRWQNSVVVVVVPRLSAQLLDANAAIGFRADTWRRTTLDLGRVGDRDLVDILNERSLRLSSPLDELLAPLPVAVLSSPSFG